MHQRARRCSITHCELTWLATAVILCTIPSGAAAQTLSLPTTPTIESELEAAPRPGQSGVSLVVGASVQEGRTETRALTVTGVAAHTTKKDQLLRLDVNSMYARYRPTTTSPDFVASDNQLATLTYLQRFKTRYALIGQTGWRRDEILGLDYRLWAEAGAGVEWLAHKRVNSFIGGSYAVGRENRGFTSSGSEVLDAGVLQTLNVVITNTLGFHEWFLGHVQTNDTSDSSYSFSASLLTKISKHSGLKISYQRAYDALHPSTVSATQSNLIIGYQLSIQPAQQTTAKP